jgi:hypothetical protein
MQDNFAMSSSGGVSGGVSGDHSWQSILDLLTAKARKDGLIASIKNAKGFEAKINKVRDSIVIRYFPGIIAPLNVLKYFDRLKRLFFPRMGWPLNIQM